METQIQVVNETPLSLITKAEIDAQVSTAKAFPRNIDTFRQRVETLGTVNEEIAGLCTYSLPRSGKNIEGPSVRFAEIVYSQYGNIRAGARVIENDGKTVTAQGFCHDLETNVMKTVEVKKKITNKSGQTFSEDMQVVTGNAACAIAFRNAIFGVIPFALVDDIYEKVKEKARGTVETLKPRIEKALAYFRQQGATDEAVLKKLEVKSIEEIDKEKFQSLIGFYSALKNGETTLKDLFEPEQTEQPKPDPTIEKINAFTDKTKLMAYKLNEGSNWNDDQFHAYQLKLTELEG